MLAKKKIHGQAIVLIVVAMIGLIAITGLAIDGGNIFADRRKAQSAADNAAMAGALFLAQGQSNSQAISGAREKAGGNGYLFTDVSHTGLSEVVVSIGTSFTRCNGDTYTEPDPDFMDIQVTIHSDVDTLFAPVIGIDQLSNCVDAIARAQPATYDEMVLGNAIVALNCTQSRGFNAHGDGYLKVVDGGIFVNSNDSSALYAGGSTAVMSPVYTVVGDDNGGNLFNADGTGPGMIEHGILQFPCPTQIYVPTPICCQNGTKSGVNVTEGYIPGSYLGGNAHLEPGVYCISGNARVNAQEELIGGNVLLYFMDGGLDLSGGATVQLSAPSTPPYTNLLVYADYNNNSEFRWNGNSLSTIYGSIVVLGSHFNMLGTGAEYGFHTQIIADTVEWGGTDDGFVVYDGALAYAAPTPPMIELVR